MADQGYARNFSVNLPETYFKKMAKKWPNFSVFLPENGLKLA